MFVREKRVKTGGREYVYIQLVKSVRISGKPRQKVLLTLGRKEDLDPSYIDEIVASLKHLTDKVEVLRSIDDLHLHGSRNLGDVHVLGRLWDELGLSEIIQCQSEGREFQFDVVAALKGMILNRCIAPQSKLSTSEWLKEDIYLPAARSLEPQHLYRALDFLSEHKEAIESALYQRLTDLFSIDVSIVFYDTSVIEMTGESADLIEFGRSGGPQVLLSLVLSRDGLPLAHEMLPGSTADVTTVVPTLEKLKRRFSIGRCLFVADRGMVSEDNLKWLKAHDLGYIVGTKIRGSKTVREEVLATRGRYQHVTDTLRVKETVVAGERYILCHNPETARRDRHIRENIVADLEEAIEGLSPSSKQAAALWSHPVKSRYLRRLKDGTLRIDRSRVREDERYEGKHVLRTDDRKMDAGEIAGAYQQLRQTEASFRSLKSLEKIAPMYHWRDRRIRAHVTVCVLAHLLERVLTRKLAQGGLPITASRAIRELGRLKVSEVTAGERSWLMRSDATGPVKDIYSALHYRLPSRATPLNHHA